MSIALRLSKLIKENPEETSLYIPEDMFDEIFDYYLQKLEIKSPLLNVLIRTHTPYVIHDGVEIRPDK